MIHFREAEIGDIPRIRELTYLVWPQTYAEILTAEQIDYMLDMMYSEPSLQHQIQIQLHQFIIAFDDDEAVGFISWSFVPEKNLYRLHKIYVKPGQQGKGTGKKLMDHTISVMRPAAAAILELNVNRHNKAKEFYIHQGFRVVREENITIGKGYFMNDYVMQKSIGGKS